MSRSGDARPLAERIAALPPHKRAAVEQMLSRRAAARPVADPIPRLPAGAPAPLSWAQRYFWMLDRLSPGDAASVMPLVAHVDGDVDPALLASAFRAAVRRHDILRTTVIERDGEPVQTVRPGSGADLELVDLSDVPEAEREQTATRTVGDLVRRPFDLAAGPLARIALVRLGTARHLLVITVHHIAADAWSTSLLVAEIGANYDALLAGRAPRQDPPPVRYADYAAWQPGQSRQESIAYWRERLAGVPAVMPLPFDRPRPPVLSLRGGTVTGRIPRETLAALRELCGREGATLFMAALAALQLTLHRFGAGDDIVVGVPVADRTRSELGEVIGCFLNTLLMRGDLSGRPTPAGLLARTRRTVLDAYEHQDTPFERMTEELPSGGPRAQVLLVFEERPPTSQVSRNLRVRPLEHDGFGTKRELTLSVTESAAGLDLALAYSADVFERATAARLLDAFALLLRRFADHPNVPAHEADLLGSEERHTVLRAWNRTADVPVPGSVPEMFRAQAARTPRATAVVAGQEHITFAELDHRSGELAARLRALGVDRESPVGLCLERGVPMVTGLLAILKAGGAYVPLDPGQPAERLALLVSRTAMRCVVTDAASADRVPSGVALLRADDPAAAPAGGRASDRHPAVLPGQAAYVLHTSGSTGTPKGVVVEHRQLARYVTGVSAVLGLRPGDRFALLQPLTVDFGLTMLLPPLCQGGEVHVVDADRATDARGLSAYLRDHRIDHLKITPSHLAALLAGPMDVRPFPARLLVLGGESSHPDWLAEVRRAADCAIATHYGPTETTVGVLADPLAGATGTTAVTVPVGRPLPGNRVYVLDDALRPVPPGVTGELYVAGEQVARGYLGSPDRTGERFVADPHGPAGARMYRTGDRARFLPDGSVEFAGRRDDQVKIRGHRVEPGEVEAVLREHPGVEDAVVLAGPDRQGVLRLAAYVRGTAGPAEVREYAGRRLLPHMVPGAVVVLERFPLMPHGKVDRAALPEPRWEDAAAFVAPRSGTEREIARIFAEVLGRPRVGLEDDFFTLGGHSLAGIRVLTALRERLGVEVPLRKLFEHPTTAMLAGVVERSVGSSGGAVAGPVVVAGPRPECPPLSFAQQRLWFLQQADPGSSAYNVPMALRLRGEVDGRALREALGDVVARHETLRTVFPDVAGEPYQRVLNAAEGAPRFDVVECGARELEDRARDAARYGFDLAVEPPLRAWLFVAGGESVLLLLLHHIACDELSVEPLLRDLSVACAARRAGVSAGLPELPVQYVDYALWQRELSLGDQLDFWVDELAGVPAESPLPVDRRRPVRPSGAAGSVPFRVDAAAGQALREVAGAGRASLFMVMHAAVSLVLARLGGGSLVPIGTPSAGRSERELAEMVGFFVNTLVVCADVSGNPSFRDLVGRVRESALRAYDHQDVPFDRVVSALGPARAGGSQPLFRVMLVQRTQEVDPPELPGLSVEILPLSAEMAKFDLTVSFLDTDGGGVEGVIEYAADVFDAETVERVAGNLADVLRAVARDPGVRVGDVDFLRSGDREALARWNDTARVVPAGTVAEFFEACVAVRPDEIALVCGAQRYTYRALRERVMALARGLVARGAGPERVVAVALPRSADAIVAALAVLCSGAVYFPLDPGLPAARREALVKRARPVLTLTAENLEGVHRSADSAASRPVPARPDNAAYVLFTSGTTGRPKGVVVSHRSLMNHCGQLGEAFLSRAPGRRLRVAHVTAFSFDAAWDPLLWMLHGHELHVVDDDVRRDPEALLSCLMEQRLDTFSATPSLVDELLAAGLLDNEPGYRPVLMALGGEPVREATWRRLRASDVVAFNLYGPTECTVDPVMTELAVAEHPVIGRPARNTVARVLDGTLRPLPPGVPGELYLTGVPLARGYWEQPGITSERFVADPWGEPGTRMYRTGDLARWTTDGRLEFLRRADEQVKVRGYRIEPREIEAALLQHPAVRTAAALSGESEDGETRLTGYVVPATGQTPDPADLRRFLRTLLPDYMVPAAFIVLDSFPRTLNGKLARDLLPKAAGSPATTAPRSRIGTPREEMLRAVFAEVLDAPGFGVDDDFFLAGGHSLLVPRIVRRVRTALQHDITIRDLFEAPTPAALAQRLRSTHDSADPYAPLLPLRPVGSASPLFCLPPSLGLSWFYGRLLRHLPQDVPLYGLQSRGVREAEPLPGSIEEIADEALARIRAVQPKGPYRLLGWSFGGLTAHAVATALRREGERVELLVVLDGYPVDAPVRAPEPLQDIRAAAALRQYAGQLPEMPPEQLAAVRAVVRSNSALMDAFVPQRFDGDLVLVTASRRKRRNGPTAESWRPFVGGKITVHEIDCGHHDLLIGAPLTEVAAIVSERLGGEASWPPRG